MKKEKDNNGREPRRSYPKRKYTKHQPAMPEERPEELTEGGEDSCSMVHIPLDEYREMKARINQLQDRESAEIKAAIGNMEIAISNMEAADKRTMKVVNVMGQLVAEIRCMSFLKRIFRFSRHIEVLLNAYFGNANGGDYITRMKAEELGLSLRIELLEKFLKTSTFSSLSHEEKCLLEDQRKAMKQYDTILSQRIMFAEKKKPQPQDPCMGGVGAPNPNPDPIVEPDPNEGGACNPDPVVEPEPECGCSPYGPGCDGNPNE